MRGHPFVPIACVLATLAAVLLAVPRGVLAQSTDALRTLEKRVFALDAAGRYAEAIPLAEQLATMTEAQFGKAHTFTANVLNTLAELYRAQGRYAEAEPVYKRSLAIEESARGSTHQNVAERLNNLAVLYYDQGRYAEAEPLYKRALAIREMAFGANHPDVATQLNNLANLYRVQGRYAEAEPLYKRSLPIREKALGLNHPFVGQSLNNLAILYSEQGRYAEAEPLLKRALAILEAHGAQRHDVAASLHNLAETYRRLGRYAEAEPLLKRSIAIEEKSLGPQHPSVASGLINLALVYHRQGRDPEAELLFKRSLAIFENMPEHLANAVSLNGLAVLYNKQGRYAEAEPLYKRSLAIKEKALGSEHGEVADSLRNLGLLELDQKRPQQAYDYFRRAAAIRTANSLRTAQNEKTGEGPEESRAIYFDQTTAAWQTAALAPARLTAMSFEAFEAAQWAGQEATGTALSQMAARFAAGTGLLAGLVRERQDLVRSWQTLDGKLIAAMSATRDQRNEAAIAELRTALTANDRTLADLTARLEREVPGYAELATPKPLPAPEAQRLLGPNEALVVFLAGQPKETFIWAVTRDSVTWQRIAVGEKELSTRVQAFRSGLDVDDEKAAVSAGRGFDLAAAAHLYATLFDPIEAVIKDKKQLIIVPSDVLTSLPFQLLVTSKPTTAKPNAQQLDAYRDAAWLIKRHAVAVLPSVPSSRALRVLSKGRQAPKPMIGFGDPVFNQGQGGTQGRAMSKTERSTTRTRSFSSYWRGTRADLEALRAGLAPLPETATELKMVARQLGVFDSDIKLGPAASEETVKRTDLTPFRIVYFATHGLVAGELKSLAEPALALTIPNDPTDLDDGLLTASEVAQLKLNADWVVLSACNTAAGDKPGAEALSGLARAFFYAGARALLVSHWRVDSEAATRLTTSTFEALQKDATIGRAEALRRAMLAYLNDTSNPWNAYPSYWGPFSIVGEGVR